VFREGDAGDEMYVVVTGKAQIVLPAKVFGLEKKEEPKPSFKGVASAIVAVEKIKRSKTISDVVSMIKAQVSVRHTALDPLSPSPRGKYLCTAGVECLLPGLGALPTERRACCRLGT
jgi:hypothetical protein